MDYAKLQLRDTRAIAWRRSSCRARGAAVSVLTYCADLENEGRIGGADAWSDEEWLTTCGLRPGDLAEGVSSGLLEWDGPDLLCRLYDHHGAQALQTKRAQGQHGLKGALNDHNARLRAAKLARQQDPPPMGVPPGPPQSRPVQTIPDQGVGDHSDPTPPPDEPSADPQPAKGAHLAETLDSLGLPSFDPEALGQWHALLTGPLVRAASEDEQAEALAWIVRQALKQGREVQYAKHAAPIAHLWPEISRARRDGTPPAKAVEAPRETPSEACARRHRGELSPLERPAVEAGRYHVGPRGEWTKGPKPSDPEEPAA